MSNVAGWHVAVFGNMSNDLTGWRVEDLLVVIIAHATNVLVGFAVTHWAVQFFSSALYPPKRGRLQIDGRSTQHDRTWRHFLRFFATVAMTTAYKLSLSSSSASMFWLTSLRASSRRIWRVWCVGYRPRLSRELLRILNMKLRSTCRRKMSNGNRLLHVACCFDICCWCGRGFRFSTFLFLTLAIEISNTMAN